METEKQQIPIQRYPENKQEIYFEVRNLIKKAGTKKLHSRLKSINGYKEKIGDYTYSNIISGKASIQVLFPFINAINQLIEQEKFAQEKGYFPPIETA